MTVKVFPRPVDRWLQAYAVPTMRTGMEVIHRFLHDGWRPAVVRLHDEIGAERSYGSVVNKGESILLLLSEGPEGYAQVEGRVLDRTALAAGLHPLGLALVEAWLEHRNDVHEFEQFIRAGLYERVTERVRREVPELIVVSGHSSHSYPQGTHLYFILGAQPPRNPGRWSDAVLHGLKVALVEKVDFAYGTSSRSSKLVHGGIRYLAYGDMGLVRESARERKVLRSIAPHLVHPLPFLFPLYKGESLTKFRTGFWMFDKLAGATPEEGHRVLGTEALQAKVPALRGPAIGAVEYGEYITDDVRLTLENALSAAQHGAPVANHAPWWSSSSGMASSPARAWW